jgi:putative pyoverdin transport system ATP-binding/permease protein
MSFLQLLRREMRDSLPRLVAMSAIGGISNAAILAAINAGAQQAGGDKANLWSAALFLIALILFIKSQQYILIVTTAESEAIVHRLRVRLMEHVRRTELLALEEIGRSEIVVSITRDTAMLTQAAGMLAFGGQGFVLIVFVSFYVAYLSFLSFVFGAAIIGLAAVLFHLKSSQIAQGVRESSEWDTRLYDRMLDLLDGFKEVRLNVARSDDLIGDISEVSRNAANIRIFALSENLNQLVRSQSAMYILLGVIVFVVPSFSETAGNASITQNTAAILFVVGTCFSLMQTLSILAAANAAADNIERLEARLLTTASAAPVSATEPVKRFEKIELRQIMFHYPDKPSEPGYQIGPINFTLHSGDVVFIAGGNGSGKSTFMKVLAGLYRPESGEILFDGTALDSDMIGTYRSLITAVFSDYHLFHRLYGIRNPDPAEVDRLLQQFDLAGKTYLTDDEFHTLDLSGGQRKRLALLVGLLEKRPILLLDEWTANQDPEYRRKFYHDLLPALKQSGTTVVLVTHDDRYVAELKQPFRLLRMDEGRFIET